MRYLILLLVPAFLFSCTSQTLSEEDLMPGMVGKVGDVILVIEDTEWNNLPGEAIREVIEAPYKRLNQYEPAFTTIIEDHERFIKFYKKYRTVIWVDIRDHIDYKDGGRVMVVKDLHARGQVIIKVG
ncbi:MAG: DUF4837 family protein, partial [Flavobacteriales bacterium]|nr:DUF4837 family protein [Flavobacteriales bacterium]